jgi:hypothetical protein
LLRHEVETGEDSPLLGQVLGQSFLAVLDLGEEAFKKLLTPLPGAGHYDSWLIASLPHHFFEGGVDLLKSSGIFWKLSSDIS